MIYKSGISPLSWKQKKEKIKASEHSAADEILTSLSSPLHPSLPPSLPPSASPSFSLPLSPTLSLALISGRVGIVLLMIYYTSPLSTIAKVVKDKDSTSIGTHFYLLYYYKGTDNDT